MARNNLSKHTIDYTNTIKKSNDISMAKLNQGLTLNQMQLLAYAIFSTQQNGETQFRKYEFQDKFGIKNYKTEDAFDDSDKVTALRFSTRGWTLPLCFYRNLTLQRFQVFHQV